MQSEGRTAIALYSGHVQPGDTVTVMPRWSRVDTTFSLVVKVDGRVMTEHPTCCPLRYTAGTHLADGLLRILDSSVAGHCNRCTVPTTSRSTATLAGGSAASSTALNPPVSLGVTTGSLTGENHHAYSTTVRPSRRQPARGGVAMEVGHAPTTSHPAEAYQRMHRPTCGSLGIHPPPLPSGGQPKDGSVVLDSMPASTQTAGDALTPGRHQCNEVAALSAAPGAYGLKRGASSAPRQVC